MKKIAVITGGAGGMGFAIAKGLAKDFYLALCDIRQANLGKAKLE